MEYMPGKWGSDAQQSTLAATGNYHQKEIKIEKLTYFLECSSATQSFIPPKNTAGEIKSVPYEVTADGSIIISRKFKLPAYALCRFY
jgi:hypothetical protein